MKALRYTKTVKEIKVVRSKSQSQGKLEVKKMFPKTIIHKIFETNSSFHVKQRNMGKA